MPRRPRLRLAFASLSLALLSLACERPDHIEIDPRMPRLTHKGETVRLHGKMMDRQGRVFSSERATWASRDPFVAAVDANGQVAALSSGHTVITARWNELAADVPLEIDLTEAIKVESDRIEVPLSGDAVKLDVTALGLDGRPQKDREVHLTSQRPEIARVDPEGKVWGVSAGEAVVKAKIDDKEAEIHVVVK
jgi:uncharacterized protein YjdB